MNKTDKNRPLSGRVPLLRLTMERRRDDGLARSSPHTPVKPVDAFADIERRKTESTERERLDSATSVALLDKLSNGELIELYTRAMIDVGALREKTRIALSRAQELEAVLLSRASTTIAKKRQRASLR
jgi:hypothetical protein